jgi:ElaB/YqjD/DUF883 family membrane-anchored ribosome-binding protein
MTDIREANDGAPDTGSTTGTGGGETTGEKLKQQFATLKSQAGDKARDVAGQGKEKATGALDDAARFLEDTARTIEEKVGPQYGRYAHSAAESVSGFASTLRAKELDELVDDARELVRKSPAVAIGAAVAVGFVLARLVKAGIDYSASDSTPTQGFTGDAGPAMGSSTASATTTPGTAAPVTPLADPTGGTSVTGSTEPTFPA